MYEPRFQVGDLLVCDAHNVSSAYLILKIKELRESYEFAYEVLVGDQVELVYEIDFIAYEFYRMTS